MLFIILCIVYTPSFLSMPTHPYIFPTLPRNLKFRQKYPNRQLNPRFLIFIRNRLLDRRFLIKIRNRGFSGRSLKKIILYICVHCSEISSQFIWCVYIRLHIVYISIDLVCFCSSFSPKKKQHNKPKII